MGLPDRWLNYSESGRIRGTRFVAFKVPLKEEYFRNLPSDKRFTPSKVLQTFPKLKLVIDLTNTFKYYNGVKEFQNRGVQYVKIMCRGHQVPYDKFEEFANIVCDFIKKSPQDYLIGVHCTHGVNRTGYLIVRYMISVLGYSPSEALEGHAIERDNYIADLRRIVPNGLHMGMENWRNGRGSGPPRRPAYGFRVCETASHGWPTNPTGNGSVVCEPSYSGRLHGPLR